MGIKNMCQCKPTLGGGMQIPVHVAQRVDEYCLFRVMRADQISGVAKSLVHKRFNKPGLFHVKIIIAGHMEKSSEIKGIVEMIMSDLRYLKNIEYGEPRAGHPEGKI